MKKFDRTKFKKKRVPPKPRGLVLYFFGDGKGKTTAAVGTLVRAHGAGLRTALVQFMKSEKWQSYERKALKQLGIPVHVLGSGFVGILDDTQSLSWHKRKAKAALKKTMIMLKSKKHDLVIADESVTALEEGLLTLKDLKALLKVKPHKTHLIITGHSKYPALIKSSDLVSEIKNIKHPYYTEGMTAQRGVDF